MEFNKQVRSMQYVSYIENKQDNFIQAEKGEEWTLQ